MVPSDSLSRCGERLSAGRASRGLRRRSAACSHRCKALWRPQSTDKGAAHPAPAPVGAGRALSPRSSGIVRTTVRTTPTYYVYSTRVLIIKMHDTTSNNEFCASIGASVPREELLALQVATEPVGPRSPSTVHVDSWSIVCLVVPRRHA